MPDFLPKYPQHKPFKCGFYWHLKKSGLYIAVYSLVGAVTAGGKNAFTASVHHVSQYFESDYETTRRVFKGLKKLGWFEYRDGAYWYVPHDIWVESHPGQCNERELLPWQVETDPLVSDLWAACGGKIRVFEKQITDLRAVADNDSEIVAMFRENLAKAKHDREAGILGPTSPRSCLNEVYKRLRRRQQQRAWEKQRLEAALR